MTDKRYIIKVKAEKDMHWCGVNEKGIIVPRYEYWNKTARLEFDSRDEAHGWLEHMFDSAQRYAKCISGITDDTTRRIIYGYISDVCKPNSVLMALINSKMNSSHTRLITDKLYVSPGVQLFVEAV